jgi:hypothetical protein
MKYQLVLQWRAQDGPDYDALIEIEETLIEKLSSDNDVDGHDFGTDEANIFIDTNDPANSFQEIKEILENCKYWHGLNAAYRDVKNGDFVALWPTQGPHHFKVS